MAKSIHIQHSQTEHWLYLDSDGNLICESENDGYAFWRHGPQSSKVVMTPEQAMSRWPFHEDEIRAMLETHSKES